MKRSCSKVETVHFLVDNAIKWILCLIITSALVLKAEPAIT